VGQAGEYGVDRPPQGARALAVNDAYLEDSPFPTGIKVVNHHLFYLAGVKGMQIQGAVNGEFNGLWINHGSLFYCTG